MRNIKIEKTLKVEPTKYAFASEEDCKSSIKEDCSVFIGGELSVVYIKDIGESIEDLPKLLDRIKYTKAPRTRGMVSKTRIFGYAPRNTLRNHPCRTTTMARDFPRAHKEIERAALIVSGIYKKFNPELSESHEELTSSRVLPEYRIANTMFTSGIVNKNNTLPYHYDTGNYKGVWSAMLGFKKGCIGGRLSIPEIGLKFETGNRSLILFDGQSLLHGVTPIRTVSGKSYRITVVFYSLQQMWNCLSPGEELRHIQKKRSEIESSVVKE